MDLPTASADASSDRVLGEVFQGAQPTLIPAYGMEYGEPHELTTCGVEFRKSLAVAYSLGANMEYEAIADLRNDMAAADARCSHDAWPFLIIDRLADSCQGLAYDRFGDALDLGYGATGTTPSGLLVNFRLTDGDEPVEGCWLYSPGQGYWMNRGDYGDIPVTLYTVAELGVALRDDADHADRMHFCDAGLRAFLSASTGAFDFYGLASLLREFVAEQPWCGAVGWRPVVKPEGPDCVDLGVDGMAAGRTEAGLIIVHWADDAVLGTPGICWVRNPDGYWRSVAFVDDRPASAAATLLPQVTPKPVPDFSGYPSGPNRAVVCDALLEAALLLSPGDRPFPDYLSLIRALQGSVEDGACAVAAWDPRVVSGEFRSEADGVELPKGLWPGTGYDPESGGMRIVFADFARPYRGHLEWIWLPEGEGWIYLYD